MRAFLALETGRVFSGRLLGPLPTTGGEVVFHTGMTGYQEILTDPSYAGQIVVFTTAHLGNTGWQAGEDESDRIHPAGVVVRDLCRRSYHARSGGDLADALADAGVPLLTDVDTRALTMAIREEGTCRGVIGVGEPAELIVRARSLAPMAQCDWIGTVTGNRPGRLPASAAGGCPCTVSVLDCGAKGSILKRLAALGCDLRIHAADTLAAEVADGVDGVVVSNGPGDPASRPDLVETVRHLLDRGVPLFGICLGHQLLARALGGQTERLPFGHHGANHPVQDLTTGRVLITSQNHNYHVPPDSLDPTRARVTHLSLNDGSVEGLASVRLGAFSVQFHPEAAPGPHDGAGEFDRFIALMAGRRAARKEVAREATG